RAFDPKVELVATKYDRCLLSLTLSPHFVFHFQKHTTISPKVTQFGQSVRTKVFRSKASLHKQRQRSGIPVQKILLPDRHDLAVTEKTGQTHRAKLLLHVLRVVVWLPKKMLPAPVATAKAAAINFPASQLFLRAL